MWISSTNTVFNMRLKVFYTDSALHYPGPAAWNSLPADIRDETDSAAFTKLLKTHYFNIAFKSF